MRPAFVEGRIRAHSATGSYPPRVDEPRALPWSLRDKLLLLLRPIVVRAARDPDLAWLVARELDYFLKLPAARSLRPRFAEATKNGGVEASVDALLPSMPSNRRTEWLVGELSRVWGITWQPVVQDDGAPIALPASERNRIRRRLDKVWENAMQRCDEPDATEYADAFEQELERIGAKHDILATRLVQRRFPDARNAKLQWTFHELLGKHTIDGPEKLLAFFERHLDVTWIDKEE